MSESAFRDRFIPPTFFKGLSQRWLKRFAHGDSVKKASLHYSLCRLEGLMSESAFRVRSLFPTFLEGFSGNLTQMLG